MRLDEYQIANALIDTRLVMTSRQVFTKPIRFTWVPPIGPNKAFKTHCGLADSNSE